MKRIIRKIVGLIKGASVILFSFLLFPFARLFLWHKRIWIITEFGYEARDNGFSFFKYMRQHHSDVHCYYAIKKGSCDYSKVEKYGNVINFGSFRHFAYWCAAQYIISSKTQGFCPSYYLSLLRKKFHLWGKYVFLQHGITKDDQKFLYKKNSKIDLFICGAKPEYDDILSKYGYRENEISYTGFARFDDYMNLPSPKNQILVMPTWRRYVENVNFTDTVYYKTWNSFLNSKDITDLLDNNNYVLYFYLHPHFKDYFHHFSTNHPKIKILSFENLDLQQLIYESKVFITDFSSLAFDFAFLNRPVIYYQYDEQEYFANHYIKGYFDYRKDGFGPVCDTIQIVTQKIKEYTRLNGSIEQQYLKNGERFFVLRDNNNCYRIYNSIIKI